MCADKTPTMHKVLPIVVKLLKIIEPKDDDEPIIRRVKEKMQVELNKRAVTEKIALMGCLMNPFTKDLNFVPELREQAHSYLREELQICCKDGIKIKMEPEDNRNRTDAEPPLPTIPEQAELEPKPTAEGETEPEEPQIKKLKSADTEDWLSDIVCIGESKPNQEITIENEFQRYLGCKILEKDKNLTVLEWWRSHEQFYPLIKNIARKYLSVPASSVSSERVFSLCGNLVNKKRCRLSPNNVDLLVFLNRNIEYW